MLFVREAKTVRVYLNGAKTPELQAETEVGSLPRICDLFLAGRSDNQFPFEGRLDEVVVFDRAVTATELDALSFSP